MFLLLVYTLCFFLFLPRPYSLSFAHQLIKSHLIQLNAICCHTIHMPENDFSFAFYFFLSVCVLSVNWSALCSTFLQQKKPRDDSNWRRREEHNRRITREKMFARSQMWKHSFSLSACLYRYTCGVHFCLVADFGLFSIAEMKIPLEWRHIASNWLRQLCTTRLDAIQISFTFSKLTFPPIESPFIAWIVTAAAVKLFHCLHWTSAIATWSALHVEQSNPNRFLFEWIQINVCVQS